jgi:hypothetical protein
VTAPCRHPAFTTERNARRRAWALNANPELRPVPVQCRYCGQWRLETPGSSYHTSAPTDQEGPAR